MPSPFQRLGDSFKGLDSPRYVAERRREDMDPRNFQALDEMAASRRGQSPRGQQALGQERRRLEQMHAQAMQQAAQQRFQQGLEQQLNPRIGTPQDSDPQAARAAFMAQLMMQMRRRYPGMQP